MAYDQTVSTGSLSLSTMRRLWRVDFNRPNATGNSSLTANAFIREDTLNATVGHPSSGSVVSSVNFMINLEKSQITTLGGFNTFFGNFVTLTGNLKDEYDASGSLSTGSIGQVNV